MVLASQQTERFALYRNEYQQWLTSLALYTDQETYFETLLRSLARNSSDGELISRSSVFQQWFGNLKAQMTDLAELISREEQLTQQGITDWRLRQEIDERHRKMRCGYQRLEQQFIDTRQNFYAFITPYVQ